MGDENTVLDTASARHLLRRTGFGALPKDLTAFTGMTRGTAADKLLNYKPHGFRPSGRDFESAHNKWIKTLVKARSPLQAKLVLFWHDHFATAFSKVQDVNLMADQISLLYQEGNGNFKTLVKDINRNPAMMEFLDTERNDKDHPNENYGRELQELFTLGVLDFNGQPNYTQEDVVQIARAFTGWRYDKRSSFLDTSNHDFNAEFQATRGPKVIYKSTGGFGPGGVNYAPTATDEGPQEIDTVIDIICQHKDSQGKNTVARRIAHRLLEYFAYPNPENQFADDMVAVSGFDTSFEITPLLRAVLVDDRFYATSSPAPFAAGTKKSVKWPVDYAVSTLRLLQMRLSGRDQHVAGGSFLSIFDQLSNMGQLLLDPPSVFGWDWETAWISSATLLARYGLARDLIASRGNGGSSFRPDRLMDLSLTDPAAIVDAVTGLLGVTDQLTSMERSALISYLTDNGMNPSLDLSDGDVRNTKLNGLFALVMESPAYQLH